MDKFKYILAPIIGDLEAIDRVTREVVDDLYTEGHIYTELRYSPHLMVKPEDMNNEDKLVQVVNTINKAVFEQTRK